MDGAQLVEELGALNQLVSGMTATEAAQALGLAANEGGIASFQVLQGGETPVVQLVGQTASDAYDAYIAAGGAASAVGAAATGAAAYGAANAAEILTLESGATFASTGGILSLSLPVGAAAIAPLLGVSLGVGLYEASPEFWTKVSQTLLPFCWEGTENLPAVVDSSGQVFISQEAVDAFKQLLEEEGIGEGVEVPEQIINDKTISQLNYVLVGPNSGVANIPNPSVGYLNAVPATGAVLYNTTYISAITPSVVHVVYVMSDDTPTGRNGNVVWSNTGGVVSRMIVYSFTYEGKTVKYAESSGGLTGYLPPQTPTNLSGPYNQEVAWAIRYGSVAKGFPEGTSQWEGTIPSDYTQGSVTVVTDPLTGTGIPYVPIHIPTTSPGTSDDPEVTPDPQSTNVPPEITPYISTEVGPSQYPEELPIPSDEERTSPLENPVPQTEPNIDPNAQPETQPDPAPEQQPAPVDPNPPSGGDSPVPFIPSPFPSINSSGSGLVHVYNPTPAELKAFGQWLWVTYADATIDKIWNNPFDGVMGAFELYATPAISGRDNIRSGFLVCPTEADLVEPRYISINCGSIVVPEYYGNYLDYAPYSKAYAYLPFIGIVELEVDDIVGHGVNITYYIDTYNGSCIAMITVAKPGYENTIYQFSGNCAVDIPLSGGSQAALKAGAISASANAIGSIISGAMHGGYIGAAAGLVSGVAGGIAHMVSQKSTVQHSGTFGASYGAMGIKKPYLIIRRPIQKKVMNYNKDYGFPAHKFVTIGACTGYLRVREVNVISPLATDEEKARIEEMLKEGVYVT